MAGLPEDANIPNIPAVSQVITPLTLVNNQNTVAYTTSGADTAQVLLQFPIDSILTSKNQISLKYEQSFDISGAVPYAFQLYLAPDDASYNPSVWSRVFSSANTAGNVTNVWNPVLLPGVDYTPATTIMQLGISADGIVLNSVSLGDATVINGIGLFTYP